MENKTDFAQRAKDLFKKNIKEGKAVDALIKIFQTNSYEIRCQQQLKDESSPLARPMQDFNKNMVIKSINEAADDNQQLNVDINELLQNDNLQLSDETLFKLGLNETNKIKQAKIYLSMHRDNQFNKLVVDKLLGENIESLLKDEDVKLKDNMLLAMGVVGSEWYNHDNKNELAKLLLAKSFKHFKKESANNPKEKTRYHVDIINHFTAQHIDDAIFSLIQENNNNPFKLKYTADLLIGKHGILADKNYSNNTYAVDLLLKDLLTHKNSSSVFKKIAESQLLTKEDFFDLVDKTLKFSEDKYKKNDIASLVKNLKLKDDDSLAIHDYERLLKKLTPYIKKQPMYDALRQIKDSIGENTSADAASIIEPIDKILNEADNSNSNLSLPLHYYADVLLEAKKTNGETFLLKTTDYATAIGLKTDLNKNNVESVSVKHAGGDVISKELERQVNDYMQGKQGNLLASFMQDKPHDCALKLFDDFEKSEQIIFTAINKNLNVAKKELVTLAKQHHVELFFSNGDKGVRFPLDDVTHAGQISDFLTSVENQQFNPRGFEVKGDNAQINEFFEKIITEWLDKNPIAEDRLNQFLGLPVEQLSDKIPIDNNILNNQQQDIVGDNKSHGTKMRPA